MKEWELISIASKFVLQSFKLESIKELQEFNGEDYQTFLGSISGILEGMSIIIKEEDRMLYSKLIDSLERVAWK
jgi:hypothetical protein